MKKLNNLKVIVIALGLTASLSALAAGAVSAPVVVSNEGGDGSIELSNISTTGSQDTVPADPKAEAAPPAEVTETSKATPPSAATPSSETASTEVANAEPPKDLREVHRDKMMQVPSEPPASTSAASRRYKKVDLATYRAIMQGASAQATPAQ